MRDEPWTMVIGEYVQIGDEKEFTTIYEIHIDPVNHGKILRGNIPVETIHQLDKWVKSIPLENLESAKKEWKKKRKEIFETYQKGLLSIDVKIDSKGQRRVQTGLKLEEIIDAGLPHTKYESQYGNIQLPFRISSPPRKRHSK